jgi:hypothetical protein
MKLISDVTGAELKVGERVKTFRDEWGTLTGFRAPSHEGSTGRVWVQMDNRGYQSEFFPSVIDVRIVVE